MSLEITTAQCDKHGDIKNSVFIISYLDQNILKHKYYCLQCVIDLLDILQKEMKFPKVNVITKEIRNESLSS